MTEMYKIASQTFGKKSSRITWSGIQQSYWSNYWSVISGSL